MTYSLRPGLHFCEVGGRYIFLDLHADRYFCLGQRGEAAFRRVVDQPGAGSASIDDVDVLMGSGLLQNIGGNAPQPTSYPPIPAISALDAEYVSVPLWTSVAAVSTLLRARAALRFGGLQSTIESYEAHKRAAAGLEPASDGTTIEAIAFERTARWLRSHDQCLSRSVALARMLVGRGHKVTLLIGVRMRPFAAHSWVQSSKVILNDRFEHVRTYSPILAI